MPSTNYGLERRGEGDSTQPLLPKDDADNQRPTRTKIFQVSWLGWVASASLMPWLDNVNGQAMLGARLRSSPSHQAKVARGHSHHKPMDRK